MDLGELKIDVAKNSVFKNGEKICLTHREFNLLVLLARNSDRVLDRTAIRKALWPEGDLYQGSRAIDVHIQHLRAKLEDDPAKPLYINTIQGMGYMFTVPQK